MKTLKTPFVTGVTGCDRLFDTKWSHLKLKVHEAKTSFFTICDRCDHFIYFNCYRINKRVMMYICMWAHVCTRVLYGYKWKTVVTRSQMTFFDQKHRKNGLFRCDHLVGHKVVTLVTKGGVF